MILLGIVLLILGLVFGIQILWILGIVAIVIGLFLNFGPPLGSGPRRRYY